MPVGINEHQMIDGTSTDLISYCIQSLMTIGFALLCIVWLFYPSVTLNISHGDDMPS